MNWRFTTFILLFSFIGFTSVSGQNFLDVNKAGFTERLPERKNAYKQIKNAALLYSKGIGFADQSLVLLLEAHKLNQINPELNYNIGICYLIAGPKDKALPFLIDAEKLNPDVSEDIHYLLGLAYQYQNLFSKAITHFKMNIELVQLNKYKDQKELIALSKKHILECKSGKKLLSEAMLFQVESTGKVNSNHDDFKPLMFKDTLYFSSRRGVEKNSRSPKDQKYYERIYAIDRVEDGFGNVEKLSVDISDKSSVALMSETNNSQFLFFDGTEGNGDLFYGEKRNSEWKLRKELKSINEKDSRESSACIWGNELYFVSDRKNGFGECDIYVSRKEKSGKWGKPVNIGGDINTEYDEGDVFVTTDGQKMFFSSRGHNTIGGYDIFRCERLASGEWGRPQNMGVPINSTDNDITYFESKDGKFYFASERSGGAGGFDIYSEKIPDPIQKEEPVEVVEEVQSIPVIQTSEPIEVLEIPMAKRPAGIEEVAMNQELVEEDFVYRVQIAACKKEMGPKDLFKRYQGGAVIEHLFVQGWHKYTIGGFETFEEAAKYRDVCGVNDAFVVLFKGGYRLGIARKVGGVN